MRMDITRKTAILALIGLVAIVTVGMNASVASRGVAHSAAVGLIDCNVCDPFSLCFDPKIGYQHSSVSFSDLDSTVAGRTTRHKCSRC
jgi:hypothetical protein